VSRDSRPDSRHIGLLAHQDDDKIGVDPAQSVSFLDMDMQMRPNLLHFRKRGRKRLQKRFLIYYLIPSLAQK